MLTKRAEKLSHIMWTPNDEIPKYGGGTYPQKPQYGLPYSSVTNFQKFIGIDVSVKTFLSAVYNKQSVLYTENFYEMYEEGTMTTYYGLVCSSFVCACLGIPIYLKCEQLINYPGVEKKENHILSA